MEDILNQLMTYIQSNADIAPFLIFGLLLLAGFNLPVSEDLDALHISPFGARSPRFILAFIRWGIRWRIF